MHELYIQNEYDLEIFMEYLKIPKKSDYNSEKRRLIVMEHKESKNDEANADDEYGFDIGKLTKEQKSISIVDGNKTLEYDLVIDEQIVNYYISYLFINDLRSCIDNIQLRFKSQWLIRWTQNVKLNLLLYLNSKS